MPGITLDKRRVFGTLHTGRDVSSLRSDECPTFLNVQHDVDGSTRKRNGMALVGEVACAAEPECWDAVATLGGSLAAGTYYVRLTHVTLAGETDIIRQTPTTFVATTGGEHPLSAVAVGHPFHMRKKRVTNWYDLPVDTPGLPDIPDTATRAYMIAIEDGPTLALLAACPDAFTGYLVYSRAPRVQDQTRLGANPDAADPLYHRVRELAKVFSFASYLGNPVFVLDRQIVQIGETGKIDRDTVDIMMPDRDGLPVLWWNVYLSPQVAGVDSGEYRWAGASTQGANYILCTEYDADGYRSPLDRVDRAAPIVNVVDVTETAPDGCIIPAKTGIRGGIYAFRTGWHTSDPDITRAPGYSVAVDELDFSGLRGAMRCRQTTWPSRVTYAAVGDGQGVEVTRYAMPDTVAGWSLFVGECAPHRVLDFTDSLRIPGDPDLLHHTTPAADYLISSTAGNYPNTLPTDFTGTLEYADDNAFPTAPTESEDARGLPPAYAQIRPRTDASSNDFRYSSSDDDGATARHRLYFPLDTAIDADDLALTTYAVFRIFVRTRPGRLASYTPGYATTNPAAFPRIRVWMNSGWTIIDTLDNPSGGFVEARVPISFDAATDLSNVVGGTRLYAVVDVLNQASVGFDIYEPSLLLYRQTESTPGDGEAAIEPPSDGEMLQFRDQADETLYLRSPLAQPMWWNTPIRQDNTADWPLQGFAESIPGNRGPKGQSIQRVFGCGDSLFRMLPSGKFQRLYQYEGPDYSSVVSDDFQMCNYLWRLFACNPGLSAWNLRFDQQQTFPMGIATLADKGSIVSVNEPADGPGVTEDVPIEYYAVACRIVEATNGYVCRSKPFLFTQTVKVNIKQGIESACLIRGTLTVEPQDTHIELYRPLMNTAFYKRAVVIPITEGVVDSTGRVIIDVTDVFDGTDADLGIPIQFNTGRPPAACMMIFNRGRVHFVPQEDRERDYFTNITSPSGLPNPEGWYDLNNIDPPLKIAAAITSLEGSDGPLRISTLKGMARIDGVSADQDGRDAFTAETISADTGWVGPRAWHEIDNVTYGMTNIGPAIRSGDKLSFVGAPGKKILDKAHLDARTAYGSWCIQDAAGRIWFAYSDDPVGCMNGALVLDQQKRGDGTDPYWSQWDIDGHSSLMVDSYTGKHVMLIGGHDGRVYRYAGRFRTDAGLFIDAEMATRPEVLAGAVDTARPDKCVWYIHGDRQDSVLVDVRKDMEIQRNVNASPQRISCNDAPVDALGNPIPLFGVGEVTPYDGVVYGLPDANEEVERSTGMGTIFRQIQFVVRQTFEEMPAGTRREAGFEVAGYALTAARTSSARRGSA